MNPQVNPGDQLDHYHIDAVVARSPTASVFRGTDLQTNRQVAIKVPHPDMETDPVFFDRFHREEEIGKTLDHPGLLKVQPHDHHSQVYMVTDWFEGKPLRQVLDEEKKLSPERAVRIASGICDALAYVQNHGIVHRNLKPENILVDAQDHIKLINFGTAAKAGSRRITFTNLAQVIGMSEYISPEELNGKRGDARSDIYSLGVMLYEMVTGQTPFPGTRPYDRVLKHPVPPREIESTVSPQLQEVIYRALEREPKNRYGNAHDFGTDLQHLDRVGVSDRPELRDWQRLRSQPLKKILVYVSIGLIPITIFGLLIYFARH